MTKLKQHEQLKVLHLVAGPLSEGASIGALNLHRGLRSLGVNSTVLSNDKRTERSDDIIVRGYVRDRILKGIGNFPLRFFLNRRSGSFNTGFEKYHISKELSRIGIDILHVHWANGIVGLRDLMELEIPVVITMRDMWYFTGGCHYPMNCLQYRISCSSCPHLGCANETQITRRIQGIKKRVIDKDNITVVAISRWLQRTAKESYIMKNKNVKYIPNSVDVDNFRIFNKYEARSMMGLNGDKKIVLLGAQSMRSAYKGSALLPEIFRKLDKEHSNIEIITFGKHSINYNFKNIKYTHLGFINSRRHLNYLYSAADVFLMPSVVEAFGKTIIESLASGTPVCVFDDTGGADLVLHKQTGYVAKNQDVNDLIKGVHYIFNNANIANLIIRYKLKHAEYDIYSTAKKYVQLYGAVMNANNNS